MAIDDSQKLLLLDIQNFYESINHKLLISIVNLFSKLEKDDKIIKLLESSLKVPYLEDGKLTTTEKGLLIGSKPDDFLATVFMKYISLVIKKLINNKFNIINDEIIIEINSVNEGRNIFELISKELLRHGLQINLSKIKIIRNSSLKLENDDVIKQIKLVKNKILSGTSSSPQFITETNLEVEEIKLSEANIENIEKSSQYQEINTYEEAINFIKFLYKDYDKITKYREKHPEYKYFTNIVASQPTDFYHDYLNLNFEILKMENLKILIKVIKNFPKSEYYSSIAIGILVFVAKDLFYNFNDAKTNIEKIDYGVIPTVDSYPFSEACQFANFQIINLLESPDIYDYQKYLILRHLFFSKVDKSIKWTNYEVKTFQAYDEDDFLDFGNFESKENELPFYSEIKKCVRKINNTQHYALKKMTNHLILQLT
ncbi:reverse transcriptase domain-containing protein [Empedobacter falsenii]